MRSLLSLFKSGLSRARITQPPPAKTPHGPKGVLAAGHREYVGGLWEEIGRLQFDFLVQEGLRPDHRIADVACGSLRAGVHLIPYLAPGHYYGIDKEAALIQAGLQKELPADTAVAKCPTFVVSDSFEFQKFNARFDYAIAQSLFTHLPDAVIRQCLSRLRPSMKPGGVLFATFFETGDATANPGEAHDHLAFRYTRPEIEAIGHGTGWLTSYIGQWGHPRGQIMVRFSPKS